MSHSEQVSFLELVKVAFPFIFQNRSVLEVGSWDINGSIRSLIHNCKYKGVDIFQGTNVDLVCHGEDLEFHSQTFDVVISCECFEHNHMWQATLFNMIRMLKPGGVIIITCGSIGRPEHGTRRLAPILSLTAEHGFQDYYKNISKKDVVNTGVLASLSAYCFLSNLKSRDLYLFGYKKSNASADQASIISCSELKRRYNIKAKTETKSLFFREPKIMLVACIAVCCSSLLGDKTYQDIRYFLLGKLRRI